MTHKKPITITTALTALVILAGISFSGASQTYAKYRVQGKHKHALVNHRVKGKNLTLAKAAKIKEEREADAPDSASYAQWFENHKDLVTGTIPNGLTHSWHEHDLMMLASKSASPLSGPPIDTVNSLGPFTQGGRTRAVLVSAADPSDNTFFAGGVSGGLWKSTDRGNNWVPINDQAENLTVTCITQSPFNSNIIYYGTGEGNRPLGDGLFKSTDGGTNFTHVTPTNFPTRSWAIAYSQRDANTVYDGTWAGLWSTTDGGTTWNNLIVGGTTSGDIGDILTFPTGYGPDNHISPVLVAKKSVGLFYYNGSSYVQITSTAFPASFGLVNLANCKTAPNMVYAIFTTSTGGAVGAVCKSTDGGDNWTACTTPTNLGTTYGFYTLMIGVNPYNSNMVCCGAVGAQYSSDAGSTWQWMGTSTF